MMSGMLRNAMARGLAQARKPASSLGRRGFAERPAETQNPAGTAEAHGQGTPSFGQAKIVVPLIIGAGGAYYLFGRNRSTTARSENAGSGQVSQQEKRPPSAGMAGQQAQRAFDPNRAAGAHPEANLQNKMAGASGTSGETGGNAKTRPDYSSGNGSGIAETNKDKGPNYEGKK